MYDLRIFLFLILAACSLAAGAAQQAQAECLIPSKPGGAMDLTCKLAQKALHAEASVPPLKLSYLPGGVGAAAWHTVVKQAAADYGRQVRQFQLVRAH